MTLQTVTVDQAISAPPQRVWERISTPAGIAQWWRPGNIAPVLGHEFTMEMGKWGNIACRIIAVEPGRRLAYTFGDFELHWTITPAERGCTLRLEHRGFDLSNPQHQFAFENMGPGWRTTVLPRLAAGLLEAT
ncbi:MAG TPA: SRPBCC domain-containing protein [Devosia sp.]